MSSTPTGESDELPPETDYAYDQAHDWRTSAGDAQGPEAEPEYTATQSPEDDGGDYGYSLAHDVPGR